MYILYNILIGSYHLAIQIAALWSGKARKWVNGRKGIWEKLPVTEKRVIWFHASSLGEYEQGRPIMEAWRVKYPDDYLVLTFYSPSGFAVDHSDTVADYICFLPADGNKNASRWYKHWNPALAVFFKYEFWLHYILQAKNQNIPLGFTSVLVRSNHFFFQPYARFFLKALRNVDFWTCQDKPSANRLTEAGMQNVVVAGDTRIDRVEQIRNMSFSHPFIEKFTKGHYTLIAGSSWSPEENMIIQILPLFPDIKILMAPHDISEGHLQKIENQFRNKSIRLSQTLTPIDLADKQILVIDRIGLLSKLYRYGDIALIGGGFGKGVHNTLEPAAYHIPVCFGPKHTAFIEPGQMISLGFGHSVENSGALKTLLEKYRNEGARQAAKASAQEFFSRHKNTTQKNILQLEKFIK